MWKKTMAFWTSRWVPFGLSGYSLGVAFSLGYKVFCRSTQFNLYFPLAVGSRCKWRPSDRLIQKQYSWSRRLSDVADYTILWVERTLKYVGCVCSWGEWLRSTRNRIESFMDKDFCIEITSTFSIKSSDYSLDNIITGSWGWTRCSAERKCF